MKCSKTFWTIFLSYLRASETGKERVRKVYNNKRTKKKIVTKIQIASVIDSV